MPRPKGSKNRKALTLDEQITAAQERVEKAKAELADAEEKLRALITLRDEEAMKELMATIASSGRSVNDVIAMLRSK